MAVLFRSVVLSVLVAAPIFLLPKRVSAALPAYMTAEGETQGAIEGDVTITGREGSIEITEYGHAVSLGVDDGGFVPGQKQHRPIRITKPMDSSSVKLSFAMTNRERLTTVTINFWRPGLTGSEENYFRVQLTNAYVVNITQSHQTRLPPDWQPVAAPMLETLTLTYEKIIWTWLADSTTNEDNWIEPTN